MTITVTCYSWEPSSGDHLFSCGAISRPPHNPSFPRFEDQSHPEGVRTQLGRTRFNGSRYRTLPWGAGIDNVRRMKKAPRRREEIKKKKAQHTKAQSSMTRTSSDLAGLLISIGKIVQREESGQSKDFEEGKWCSSHACMTATCEQSQPKQGEGKDQASDTYNWLSCTWKLDFSLADSSGVELTSMTSQSILPEVRR